MAKDASKSDSALAKTIREDSVEAFDDVDGIQFSRLCPPVEATQPVDTKKRHRSGDPYDTTDGPQFSRLFPPADEARKRNKSGGPYDAGDGMQFSREIPSYKEHGRKHNSENFIDQIQFTRQPTPNSDTGTNDEHRRTSPQQQNLDHPIEKEKCVALRADTCHARPESRTGDNVNCFSQHVSGLKGDDTDSIPPFEYSSEEENEPLPLIAPDISDGIETENQRLDLIQFGRMDGNDRESAPSQEQSCCSCCKPPPYCRELCDTLPVKIALVTVIPLFALVLFIADVVTDIKQAVEYKQDGEMDLFAATIVFVIIPAVAMMAMDISWVFIDRKNRTKNATADENREILTTNRDVVDTPGNTEATPNGKIIKSRGHFKRTIFRALLSFFTFGLAGRIFRTFRYWWLFVKVILMPKDSGNRQKREEMRLVAISLQRDCHMISFIEAFLESTPQLFVQLYIFFAFKKELDLLRGMNMSSSILSIAWTYSAYYRSNREVAYKKADVSYVATGLYFLAALFCLVPRFTSLVLFAAYIDESYLGPIVIGVVLFFHFIVMFLYILWKLKPNLTGTVEWFGGKFLYYAFFAYVQLFLFMNLSNKATRRRVKLLYGMIYFENAALTIVLAALGQIDFIFALLVIALPMVLHTVCLGCYYSCLHPKHTEIMQTVCKQKASTEAASQRD